MKFSMNLRKGSSLKRFYGLWFSQRSPASVRVSFSGAIYLSNFRKPQGTERSQLEPEVGQYSGGQETPLALFWQPS